MIFVRHKGARVDIKNMIEKMCKDICVAHNRLSVKFRLLCVFVVAHL